MKSLLNKKRKSNPLTDQDMAGLLRLTIAIVVALFPLPAPANAGGWFEQKAMAMNDYHLYDAGIVDFNGDGILDIYTANCYSLSSVTPGDGNGGFGPNLTRDLKLDQDPNFPGSEHDRVKPAMVSPGLYVYWFQDNLWLNAFQISDPLSGSLTTYRSSTDQLDSTDKIIAKTNAFLLKMTEEALPSGLIKTTYNFTARWSGRLAIHNHLYTTIRLSFPDTVPLTSIFVGQEKVHPVSHSFEQKLGDRHGHAWADFNGDGLLDLFIARGGLRNSIAQFPQRLWDELMVNTGAAFENRAEQAGILKNDNRGERVAWVDFNNDGRLDLYLKNNRTFDQLYSQQADGTFIDVAPALGLDLEISGPFVWMDFDRDGDQDLIVADRKTMILFVNNGATFEKKMLGTAPGGIFGTMTVADYDNDGDLDIFKVSPNGNTLLGNTGSTFSMDNPASLGLPSTGLTANFVDYDNDGLVDLHILPGGLYRQNGNHLFSKTALLSGIVPQGVPDIRCNWFDFDNDGARDLLVSYRVSADDPYSHRSKLLQNVGITNHWLELDLSGKSGNSQAIGARVQVKAGKLVQTQQVGQSEGSHTSQGHFRLYFGLGWHTRVDSVTVYWPDGGVEILKPSVDQVVGIAQQ